MAALLMAAMRVIALDAPANQLHRRNPAAAAEADEDEIPF